MLQVARLRLFCIAILLVTLTVEGWVLNNGDSMSSTRTLNPSFKIQHVSSSRRKSRGRVSLLSLQAANDDKKGYKFGDFTKAIGRKVTGDDDYKVNSLQIYSRLLWRCIPVPWLILNVCTSNVKRNHLNLAPFLIIPLFAIVSCSLEIFPANWTKLPKIELPA